MAIFNDIELEWNGTPYSINGDDQIMRVLAAIEEHVTFIELEQGRASGKMPMAKLSTAYAVALRSAGCPVSPAEVYNGMWSEGNSVQKIIEAVSGLLGMMIPKSAIESSAKKKEAAAKPKTSAAKSSKPRTKPQS